MAKKFTYVDTKSGNVVYETVEPNYVSIEDVDKKVVAKTGQDPRLNPFISRYVRAIGEKEERSFGRFDKNKRMS